jgi:hypothetical protein
MNSHVIDYEIFGDDLQFVEVELDRQETAVAIQTICWALTAQRLLNSALQVRSLVYFIWRFYERRK